MTGQGARGVVGSRDDDRDFGIRLTRAELNGRAR
jgi:hypothetical protein